MGTCPLGDPNTLPAPSFQHSLVVLPLLPPRARCQSSHVPRYQGLCSLRERRVFGSNSSILGFPGATCPCVLPASLTEQEGAHARWHCPTNPHAAQMSRLDAAFKAPSSSSSACNPLQTEVGKRALPILHRTQLSCFPPLYRGKWKIEVTNQNPPAKSQNPATSQ